MKFLKNKRFLIIGGTGTIANGLVRRIMEYSPEVIRIFSRDEYKQFKLEHDEFYIENKAKLRFLIGDVRDYERVERAMSGIDYVFNLAAMKHVPSCEYNPEEAIKTNIIGMQNVIKAAIKNEVNCVLFTSSDKAISPTNTYGATKMLAEKLVQSANFSNGEIKTKFIAVRFGNVMGSRGSVIPLFKKQIIENREITITDPHMNRFMMSLSQAVDLMLKACKISVGGELFVLKMPVLNLEDLSDMIIELVSEKYEINKSEIRKNVIGIRAGERNDEELMTIDESKKAKDLGDMYVVFPEIFNKREYSEIYNDFENCKVESYSSGNKQVINRFEIKRILKNERLI